MSKLEVDKIDPQSGTDLELGTSGDTVTIPTGVTLDASNATTSLPSNVVTTDGTQTLTNKSIAATQLTGTITPSDNTVSLAKLTATGTKDATTFLRGDNSFQEVPAGGITMADQWRLTADSSGNGAINSNLERNDSTGFNYIGTGMTESSGVFSFPSTGIYYVHAKFNAQSDGSGGNDNNITGVMYVTTDNSNYTKVSEARGRVDNTHDTIVCTSFIDVTNISNVKVYFNKENFNTGSVFSGNTSHNMTEFTFIRLGDT